MEKKERFKQAEFAAMVGVVINLVLAIIKGVIGVISNSRALIADALHSASDVAGSMAVYVGLRAAKLPPDKDHPYGHGKAENIAAIIVAVLMVIVGFEIALSSVEAFFKPIEAPGVIAIYAAAISIIVKEILFRWKYRLGKKLRSDALIINAYEHRSDVFSSIATLVGIVAAVFGGKLGFTWAVYADPVAGLVVGILILKMAWNLGSESIHNTLDHVLHEEDTVHLVEIAKSVDKVLAINSLQAREHGHYVIVDIKVAVDPFMTVEEGHKVGKNVKEKLLSEAHIQDVFVHINPYSDEGE
ncbi:cation-efflux pump [Lottiidibacillus patelloidae]|uniref:Cation-efflux pump n=1 Tax=Lottiidibacillus patelloidae TaxID=2670334 RepID=A0A263BW75_9BACI|nr:cation diffusion facilitator family transporter [Lottiidibacillus patelloidae]OZM57828.1 cation-efflux pump [Lottiidibacillus patelloidae]